MQRHSVEYFCDWCGAPMPDAQHSEKGKAYGLCTIVNGGIKGSAVATLAGEELCNGCLSSVLNCRTERMNGKRIA